jgi:hypothetical protein
MNIIILFKKIKSISLEHVKDNGKAVHSFLLICVSAKTKDKINLTDVNKNKKEIKSYTIDHNDLSDFSRLFFPYLSVVIHPRKRESKDKKKIEDEEVPKNNLNVEDFENNNCGSCISWFCPEKNDDKRTSESHKGRRKE